MSAATNSRPQQAYPHQQRNGRIRAMAPEYIPFPPPPPINTPFAPAAVVFDPPVTIYYPPMDYGYPPHLPPFPMAGEGYHPPLNPIYDNPPPYYPPGEQPPYLPPQHYSPPRHQQPPLVPPVPQGIPVNVIRPAPTCERLPDPEAKLFVGDLPMQMTTQDIQRELIEKFGVHGPCTVNVLWNNCPARGNEKTIPTGWVQYKNFIDANAALMWAKNEGFRIGNRSVRVERADGKRICRLYPSDPSAAPTLRDFKKAIAQFIHWTGSYKNVKIPIHISDTVEKVEKNFGGQKFQVPSVGINFRWCEDAKFAQDKFPKFTFQFKLDIERVNITNDIYWRLPSVRPKSRHLRRLNALGLDPSEVWRQDRKRLLEEREDRHRSRLESQGRASTDNNDPHNNNNRGNGTSDPCHDYVDILPPEILRFPKQSAGSRFNSRRGSSVMDKKTSYIISNELRGFYDPALESAFMV